MGCPATARACLIGALGSDSLWCWVRGSLSGGCEGVPLPVCGAAYLRAERTGPGALTHLTNRVFLHSWAGAKSVLGAAAWAGCQLLGAGRPDARFRLAVRTAAGRTLHLSVVRARVARPGLWKTLGYPP